MDEQVIEVEADSLDAAREAAQKQLKEGYYILTETVLSNAFKGSDMESANTIEEAFKKAEKRIPKSAYIERRITVCEPKRKTLTVSALDEKSAINEADSRWRNDGEWNWTIVSVMKHSSGKKGFLGIGREPNQYEVVIEHPADVRVEYSMKARITVRAVSLDCIIDLLSTGDGAARKEAWKALGKIDVPRAKDTCIIYSLQALKSSDPDVISDALSILQGTADPRAKEAAAAYQIQQKINEKHLISNEILFDLINLGTPWAARKIWNEIKVRGNKELVENLSHVVGEEEVISHLVIAFHDPEAQSCLKGVEKESTVTFFTTFIIEQWKDHIKNTFLHTDDYYQRCEAYALLNAVGWQPAAGVEKANHLAVTWKWDECAALGEPAAEPLICALLTGKAPETRTEAVNALAKMGESAAAPLLARLKEETSHDRRRLIVTALGRTMSPLAVDPLLDVLMGEASNMRGEVVDALSMLKVEDERITEVFIETLKKRNKQVFVHKKHDNQSEQGIPYAPQLVRALGMKGDPRACEPVIDYMFIDPHYGWHGCSQDLQPLFGDYVGLIVNILNSEAPVIRTYTTSTVEYDQAYETWMSLSDDMQQLYDGFPKDGITEHNVYGKAPCYEAMAKLCELRTRTADNLLNKIKDMSRSGEMREAAEKELSARGDPPYDPEAYLKDGAWKILH